VREALARRSGAAGPWACVAFEPGGAAAAAWAASAPSVRVCLRAERTADPHALVRELAGLLSGPAR